MEMIKQQFFSFRWKPMTHLPEEKQQRNRKNEGSVCFFFRAHIFGSQFFYVDE